MMDTDEMVVQRCVDTDPECLNCFVQFTGSEAGSVWIPSAPDQMKCQILLMKVTVFRGRPRVNLTVAFPDEATRDKFLTKESQTEPQPQEEPL